MAKWGRGRHVSSAATSGCNRRAWAVSLCFCLRPCNHLSQQVLNQLDVGLGDGAGPRGVWGARQGCWWAPLRCTTSLKPPSRVPQQAWQHVATPRFLQVFWRKLGAPSPPAHFSSSVRAYPCTSARVAASLARAARSTVRYRAKTWAWMPLRIERTEGQAVGRLGRCGRFAWCGARAGGSAAWPHSLRRHDGVPTTCARDQALSIVSKRCMRGGTLACMMMRGPTTGI